MKKQAVAWNVVTDGPVGWQGRGPANTANIPARTPPARCSPPDLLPQLTRPPRSTRVSSAPTSSAEAEPTRAPMRVSSVWGVSLPSLQELQPPKQQFKGWRASAGLHSHR